MHEFSIIENILKTTQEVADHERIGCIKKINLVIGRMRQIVPDVFEYAFLISVKGTIAEKATLSVEYIPIKMKCSNCELIFKVPDNIYFCPGCGGVELELITGNELYIKSIEGS